LSGDNGKNQPAFVDNKASEQVANLLQKVQKKDKIFIPLKSTGSQQFNEVANPPVNHAGMVVFSSQGFVSVPKQKGQESDFVSNEQFINDGVIKQIYGNLPFFRKFKVMSLFKQWRTTMKWNAYQRRRE
jgi:hypothetical protein